jgi:hypothetical protein
MNFVILTRNGHPNRRSFAKPVRLSSCAFLVAIALLGSTQISAFGQAFDIQILDTKGYRTSKLIGGAVFNDRDETIGKVDEIIMTVEGSFILAVQVGPFIGVPSKTVLFPFIQLDVDNKNSKIVARDASKDQLKKMAAFVFP